MLGLEPRYEISPRELRAAWMRRAAVEHPDASGVIDTSARVNDAMRVLSDPILRAQALLELRGMQVSQTAALPQAFLLEMMELRERADDAAGDAAALASLREEAAGRRASAIAEIARVFAGGEVGGEGVAAVERSILAVRAFDRMLEQLAREEQGPEVPHP